jgi:hypothetical protein
MIYTIEYWDGDNVDLEYNEEKHSYMVDGEKVPSVTRVIDAVFPKYLTDWATKAGADWWLNTHILEGYTDDYFLGNPQEADIEMQNITYNGIRYAHKEISKAAQDIGSDVHRWIELYIKGKMIGVEAETDYPERVKVPMQNFHKWADAHDIEWESCEEKIYSRNWQYAGTVDAVAKINGKRCVIDFKTSAKIYKEYYLQVAAYVSAIGEMRGELPELGVIVRLDKEEGKFQEVAFDPWQHTDVFIDALNIKRFQSDRIKKVKL